jgi:hypothetical protein
MKTGGTSLVVHLLKEFRPPEIYPDAELDRKRADDVGPYAALSDLVALTPERREQIRFYSGHFPFVARDLIGPDVQTLTLLREPVARTVSVLKHFKRLRDRYRDLPLEEIYDDPVVFRFFVENHQTKVFSVTAADCPDAFASALSFEEISARLDEPGRDEPGRDGSAPTHSGDVPDTISPDTSTPDTITVDDARLELAKANLDAVDVVGLDAEYHEFVEDLRSRFGWWPRGIDERPRANVSSEPWTTSAALRDRIARDCRYDVELYAYAQELMRGRRRLSRG